MSRLQFEGRTPAEAAIKACEELGTTRSALKYDVVSDEGEGIDRKVVISVDKAAQPVPSAPVTLESSSREARSERAPREDRGGGRDRGGRGGDRGGRGGDRGGRGGDRGGRGGDRGGRGGDRGGRGGRGDREAVAREADDGIEALLRLDQVPAVEIPERVELSTASPKAAEAKTALNEVLRLLGWQANAAVVQDDEQEIHLDVKGTDSKRVAGKKGEPLLSLQFLLNRMVSNKEEGTDQVVVLDVGGYRERRRAALADLAKRLAARAVEEHKVVKLSPMSAHDRRVFHVTLTEISGVTTRSEGEGLFRRLLIIPSEFAAH